VDLRIAIITPVVGGGVTYLALNGNENACNDVHASGVLSLTLL
jgi:hypothetical protein